MSNFVVIIVAADGLALLAAEQPTSTEMTKLRFNIRRAPEEYFLINQGPISQRVNELMIQILKIKNTCCSYVIINDQIRPQFCTCHDS